METMGARVRSLRRSAGLSQAELAAGRFSKEYVSQIERGKTRPTAETLEWLASRLRTDREYLEHGVSMADKDRFEAALRDGGRQRGNDHGPADISELVEQLLLVLILQRRSEIFAVGQEQMNSRR